MFDTMTLTKAAAAVISMWLVLLLGKWGAETLYHVGTHGEPSYTVAVEESAPAEGAAAGPSFEELYAKADPAAGEKLFRQCASCHKTDGTNATGPHLDGVVGRPVASVAGFSYDDALKGLGGDWSPDRINDFITNPKAYAPGTKMTYSGMKKPEDRANLISYLASLSK